ncbi:MAG: hypothetical protein H6607_10675 [Flavobacteriales bacterium]|nr:hypothetical protein [Flavobacteriales bacterium]
MEFSKYLFRDVIWSFFFDPFDTQAEFEKELKNYHEEIDFRSKLNLDFKGVALENKDVAIQYIKWNEEEEDHDEERIILVADNGKYFTNGELMYKIHQALAPELENDERHFFEGLLFGGDAEPENPGIPLYFVLTGS